MNRSQFLREAMPAAAVATLLGASVISASAEETDGQDREKGKKEELPEIRALLTAHDEAFTSHDLDGVMKTFSSSDRVVLMGTGPGELWNGQEAIRSAYTEMFKGFDKGSQSFDYKFRAGGIGDDLAWLTTSGVVKLKFEGKDHEFVLNLSLVLQKNDGAWKIISLHYSNLQGPISEEVKEGA